MAEKDIKPININPELFKISSAQFTNKAKTLKRNKNKINPTNLKKELLDKLEEFASPTESLDEIFENKEQIEVSKFYEKLPKAHAMAVENWLNEKIYFRNTEIKE